MPLMILRMNMFCYSAFQYNTRLKIITIVFTVTRWICRSYNLHSSENEFHFMIENQKYSLHKKWSFPLRISSVNFEICRKLDLVTFAEEVLNGRLHFSSNDYISYCSVVNVTIRNVCQPSSDQCSHFIPPGNTRKRLVFW